MVLVEDMVVDIIFVVFEYLECFVGNVLFKIYVIGIFKYKIIDVICLGWCEVCVLLFVGGEFDEVGMCFDEVVFDSLFVVDGYYISLLLDWGDLDVVLLWCEFFDVL